MRVFFFKVSFLVSDLLEFNFNILILVLISTNGSSLEFGSQEPKFEPLGFNLVDWELTNTTS